MSEQEPSWWTWDTEDDDAWLSEFAGEDIRALVRERNRLLAAPAPLDGLRALSDAATPGPWVDQEPGPNDVNAGTRWIDTHAYPDGPEPVFGPTYQVSRADAAFIVATANYVRAALPDEGETT